MLENPLPDRATAVSGHPVAAPPDVTPEGCQYKINEQHLHYKRDSCVMAAARAVVGIPSIRNIVAD